MKTDRSYSLVLKPLVYEDRAHVSRHSKSRILTDNMENIFNDGVFIQGRGHLRSAMASETCVCLEYFIECGKCYSVLNYLGENHNCPDDDEGFYEEWVLCLVCENQHAEE